MDAKVNDLPDIKFQLSRGLSNPFIQIYQHETIRSLIESPNLEVAAKRVIFLIQFFSLSIMPELVVQDTQRTSTPSHRRERSRQLPHGLHIRTDSISGNTLQAPASPFSVPLLATTPTHKRNPALSLTLTFNFNTATVVEKAFTPQQPKRSLYQNPNQARSIDDLGVDYRTTEPVVPKPRKPVPVFAALPQQQTGTDATASSRRKPASIRTTLKPNATVPTFGLSDATPANPGLKGSKLHKGGSKAGGFNPDAAKY